MVTFCVLEAGVAGFFAAGVAGLDVVAVDLGSGAFFATGADALPLIGVDFATTFRGEVVVEVEARLMVDVWGVAFAAASAMRAFEAAVGADSLLAEADPPVCCGLRGLRVAGGCGTTEGRDGFAVADAVALESVEGREEGGGLDALDAVALVCLEVVAEVDPTLGFVVAEELGFETAFVTFVDLSVAGFGVTASFGNIVSVVSVTGGASCAMGSSTGAGASFTIAGVGSGSTGSTGSGAGGTVAWGNVDFRQDGTSVAGAFESSDVFTGGDRGPLWTLTADVLLPVYWGLRGSPEAAAESTP